MQGFLTIEHDAGLHLRDDFLLVGKSSAGKWSHSVHPLRAEALDGDTTSTSVPLNSALSVHSISNDVHVLSTQFDEPFAYSTSSWVPAAAAEGDDCRKDVQRFRPVHDVAAAQEYAGQRVNVITLAEERRPYEYWLKSALSPPHMKFIIPGILL